MSIILRDDLRGLHPPGRHRESVSISQFDEVPDLYQRGAMQRLTSFRYAFRHTALLSNSIILSKPD